MSRYFTSRNLLAVIVALLVVGMVPWHLFTPRPTYVPLNQVHIDGEHAPDPAVVLGLAVRIVETGVVPRIEVASSSPGYHVCYGVGDYSIYALRLLGWVNAPVYVVKL
jgi:hypothetical protein